MQTMTNESTANIQTEKKGALATIEFSSSPHNALNSKAMQQLAAEFNRCGEDSDVRVIIVKSGGERAFCAGANFNEMLSLKTLNEATQFFGGFASLYFSMVSCPKIIISQVQGKTVGGGIGIIAASDLSFACRKSEIRLSELAVGIGPFVVGPIIQHKIGLGNLSKLAYAPKIFFSPEWAMSAGLYAEMLDNFDELEKRVKEKADELLAYNPAALIQIKHRMNPNLVNFKELLEKRKRMSAELLMTEFTQQRLSELTQKT